MEHAEKLETWNNYNNLAETKARKSEKITCICGAVITRGKKAQHEGMKKHLLFLTNPEEHEKIKKTKEKREKIIYTCGCGKELNITQSKASVMKIHNNNNKNKKFEKKNNK